MRSLAAFGALASLCVTLVAFPGCENGDTVQAVTQAVGAPKVVVATRKTEFKDAVVNKVQEALQGKPVELQVVDLEKLAEADTGDAKAVVILDHVWASKVSKEAQAFLGSDANKDKAILVATAKKVEWRYDDPAVDAVTSASQLANVDQIIEFVVAQLGDRLGLNLAR
jgi:hypothetical protein